jgi:hypothetical protein
MTQAINELIKFVTLNAAKVQVFKFKQQIYENILYRPLLHLTLLNEQISLHKLYTHFQIKL